MVFSGVSSVLIGIIVAWIVILTIFTVQMIRHYNHLIMGVTKTGLKDILEGIVRNETEMKKRIADSEVAIRRVEKDGTFHIQRIGIVRFNPFSDTGGSQSFSMAILDAQENGIVVTSLYARTGNRWYSKEVHGGRGKDLELSKEEEAAIKKANLMQG